MTEVYVVDYKMSIFPWHNYVHTSNVNFLCLYTI